MYVIKGYSKIIVFFPGKTKVLQWSMGTQMIWHPEGYISQFGEGCGNRDAMLLKETIFDYKYK